MLKEQIESAPDTDIYFQAEPHVPESHLMSAVVGVSAFNVVAKHIKCSTRLDFYCKSTKEDSKHSVVGCVSVSSDKSQTFLVAGGLPLYLFHFCFRIFQTKWDIVKAFLVE